MDKKVDGRCFHYLRFADDIVLIAPNIERAEQSLADSTCEEIGLRLNLTKTIFIRSGLIPDASYKQNGTNISGRFNYVYLSQEREGSIGNQSVACKACPRQDRMRADLPINLVEFSHHSFRLLDIRLEDDHAGEDDASSCR
ncbi:unnamed protein product [Haemonchus placei]|uniref:Reverse transcriptase domain-containing protein n=1 Tax=Haemonchus placei TaxID=6290 RepID=A0A0N4WU98_HAEPC|nr:unnamed protein product [Haemonchus placei]